MMKPNNLCKFFCFFALIGAPILSFCDHSEKIEQEEPNNIIELYRKSIIHFGENTAPFEVNHYYSFDSKQFRDFMEEVFPQIKEKYIETGLIKWTFYPLPFDRFTALCMEALENLEQDKRKQFFEAITAEMYEDSSFFASRIIHSVIKDIDPEFDVLQHNSLEVEKLIYRQRPTSSQHRCPQIRVMYKAYIEDWSFETLDSRFEDIFAPDLDAISRLFQEQLFFKEKFPKNLFLKKRTKE